MMEIAGLTFTELWARIVTLFIDPASNLTGALLLYAIITAFILVMLIGAIMFLISAPEDEDDLIVEVVTESGAVVSSRPAAAKRASKVKKRADARTWLIRIAITAAVIIGVWVLAGFTTSNSAICAGCHVMTPHTQADKGSDPHPSVACVKCHEPAGVFSRYFVQVPGRIGHFASDLLPRIEPEDYGAVASSGCQACHAGQMDGVVVNKDTGVRMQHKEPLEAGALCLDCHELTGGVVSARTVGMNPCMRCHDAKTASAECDSCHDQSAAAAAQARTTQLQKQQIAQVNCGGCHNQERDCDTCHGMRMPHSNAFKTGAHARAAAVDVWYNGGRTCFKCHTATRNPCTKCHTKFIGKAHPISMAQTHKAATEQACDTCHMQWKPTATRSFCKDTCHSEAAKAESPR